MLTVTPGADMAVITRIALTNGMRCAFSAVLGICSGLYMHALASAVGLAAVFKVFPAAFVAVRMAGAGYLVFLGIQAFRRASASWEAREIYEAEAASLISSFMQGTLTNLLNSKVILFYMMFLPQFVRQTDPLFAKSLLLASIHIGMGLVWLTAYAFVISAMGNSSSAGLIKRRMQQFTGCVLVALGLRLAWRTQ